MSRDDLNTLVEVLDDGDAGPAMAYPQIELYDQAGVTARRFNCWPSECTQPPELDSESNVVAL